LLYLRAICFKHLNFKREAEKDYEFMLKAFNRQEGLKIGKYVFGMLLMPLEQDRMVFKM